MEGSAVQETNDSSSISKHSMVTAGYLKDDFIKYFVEKKHKRAPLINVGYFTRAVVMNKAIELFLLQESNSKVQILSLGSGFDTAYFKIELSSVKYFEIDLFDVVRRKLEFIKNNKVLFQKISIEEGIIFGKENESLKSSNYCIFAHDLSELIDLEMKLIKHGFNFDLPTLIVSECAIIYMEEEKSSELIGWIQKMIPKAVFILYEQINPDDSFGRIMTSHFIKISNPLRSINTYKSIEDQIARNLSSGWYWSSGVSVLDFIYKLYTGSELWEKLKIELFDEFEEWHLKCGHYSIVIATNSEYFNYWKQFVTQYKNDLAPFDYKAFPKVNWEPMVNLSIERFGHSCLPLNDDCCLVVGGFGNDNRKHCRQNNILQVTLKSNTIHSLQVECVAIVKSEQPAWDCMYSTCTALDENRFILYGGRRSPAVPVNIRPWLFKYSRAGNDSAGKIITGAQILEKNDLEPCPRWRHSAVLVHPGNILIYGGLGKNMEIFDDLWLLRVDYVEKGLQEADVATMSWRVPDAHLLSTTKPPSCFSHSVAIHNRRMFLSGGYNRSFAALSHLWCYDMIEGWHMVNTVPSLKPRYGHTSHVVSDQLILIGGVNINYRYQPGLATVCLKTFTVIEYDLLPCKPEYPVLMSHNHVSIYRQEDNSIYIIGGGGNCFSFGTYFTKRIVRLPRPR